MRDSLLIICFLVCTLAGCDERDSDPENYRALPTPQAECPVVNPSLHMIGCQDPTCRGCGLRQRNFMGGPNNLEGSCAHASLISCFNWINEFELAGEWRKQFNGGEYASRMRQRLDAKNVKYAYTDDGALELFDFAHNHRLAAILWWKKGHCCTFCGWVQDATGKVYACILDNNSIAKYEFTEKSQFKRLHDGYGGFALCPIGQPPSLPPYRSYERISARPH